MLACLAIVVTFQTSDSLGNAYGLSVIGTMTITSLIYFVVLRRVYHWPLIKAVALISVFLAIDILFLLGNIVKIFSGAWVPIAIALVVFLVFWAWTEGRARYLTALDQGGMPLSDFLHQMKGWPARQPGTTVFLGPNRDAVPLVGGNNWIRVHARNEQVVHVVIQYHSLPYVSEKDRVKVEQPAPNFFIVTASFGFLQEPDVQYVLEHLPEDQLRIDHDCRVFYLPDPVEEVSGSWVSGILVRIFQILRRNSLSTASYYKLPLDQVVHVGIVLKM
jgi:KUP system potassium uptake protein